RWGFPVRVGIPIDARATALARGAPSRGRPRRRLRPPRARGPLTAAVPLARARAEVAPEHLALVGEGLLAQRAHEAGNRLAREAPAVHAVDPGRVEQLDPVDHRAHGILVRADAHLPVEAAHLAAEVLAHNRCWSPGWMKRSDGNGLLVDCSNSTMESQCARA